MARRLLSTLLTTAVVAVGTLAVAPPASAAPAATINAVETPQPGHVVVTVQSMQPYVGVRLVDDAGDLYWDATMRAVDSGTHTATIDLSTWGLGAGSKVRVAGCSNGQSWSCTEYAEQAFTPVDAAPTITWDEKVRVTADDPNYRITVSDPQGDGSSLWAVFGGSTTGFVQRSGKTVLSFPKVNRTGSITIRRCSGGTQDRCVDTGVVSPDLEVRTGIPVWIAPSTTGPIRPTPESPVEISVFGAPGDYLLDWWVSGLPSVGASDVPVTLESDGYNGVTTFPVDLTGAPSGTRRVQVRLKRYYPGFGTVRGTSGDHDAEIEVDVTPPHVTFTLDSHLLYPHADGYRDAVMLTLGGDAYDMAVDVLSPSGAVVRTLDWTGSWDGRDAAGKVVPPGRYTLRVTASDYLGNTGVTSTYVDVHDERLVTKTFRRKVSAAGSQFRTYVGSCSKVVKPAARRWKGSIGLYSNTKCKKGWKPSVMESLHEMRLPTGVFSYKTLKVTTYGGAAKSARGSYLFLDHWSMKKEEWGDNDKRLGYSVGSHPGATKSAAPLIDDKGWTVWSVWTGDGARYDVRDFTVELTYQVLV